MINNYSGKFLILLVSALFLLGLTASCGGKSEGEGTKEASSDEKDGGENGKADGGNGDEKEIPYAEREEVAGVKMALDVHGLFFDKPFPMDAALEADGTIDVTGFTDERNDYVKSCLQAVDEIKGFSTVGGVYMPFEGAIDEKTLPQTVLESIAPEASAFLVNIEPDSRNYGKRVLIIVGFKEKGETLSAPNLLAALPVHGISLDPNTTYAFIVTDKVKDKSGKPVGSHKYIETVKWGWQNNVNWSKAPQAVKKLVETSEKLGAFLKDGAVQKPPIEEVRAFTVFTTYDPTVGMKAIARAIEEDYSDTLPSKWEVTAEYEDYCLIEGVFPAPRWQKGEPPYLERDLREGVIEFQNGKPVLATTDELRFSLTLPKGKMPEKGFPFMAYGHGMGGDYLQGIHRGADYDAAPPSGIPSTSKGKGSGPARVVARHGIAAGGLDAVGHGARSKSGSGGAADGLNYFNFFNPWSVKNNVRQTVGDYMLFFRAVSNLSVDASVCPGVDASASPDGKARWDGENTFYMGHSLGTSIGGVIAAADSKLRASILSGAGGSAISFVLSQKSPVDIARMLEISFKLKTQEGEALDELDPILTVLQMIFDEADTSNFARFAWSELPSNYLSRSVLQLHGLGDTYTPEFTARSVSCAFAMDVMEGEVDPEAVERVGLNGGKLAKPPIKGNRILPSGEEATFALYSYEVPGAPKINPHYGTFRMEEVKFVYGCFLKTFLEDGVPSVLAPIADSNAPCR